MAAWPKDPVIYEINTWVWLEDLRARYRQPITLASVPASEWDVLADAGFDAVWLMGVWERSPEGARIAREEPALKGGYREALPDVTPADVVGSPYSIHRYVVDDRLGGATGLAAARSMLAKRGLRLILDFVPNHVAVDHPWVTERPELFIQGDARDWAQPTNDYHFREGRILGHGRDPHFPAWTDTAQLNAFAPGTRRAQIETLREIARQCDGVRCDMAMLPVSRVFAATWGSRAGTIPATEYWSEIIPAVREAAPDFVFIAEAYWDMEWELLSQGLNFCYDKRLYDRLLKEGAESVRAHLQAHVGYQERLVRFIENHDEPRSRHAFGRDRSRAGAVIVATLPGAKLLHDGQLEGRDIRLPVQLGRRPAEPPDRELESFYRKLFAIRDFRGGEWRPCTASGWPDNDRYRHLLAWCWYKEPERWIVVVNYSGSRAEGVIQLPWHDLAWRSWRLVDLLNQNLFVRHGDELQQKGLYVMLDPWRFHFLSCTAA